MPTYPLTFPSVGIRQSSFRLVTSTASSVSPFTFRQQVYKHPGQRWEGEVTFRRMSHSDVADVKAFMTDLQGQFGTFLYGDPDFLAKGPRGALGGTPLVDGGSQTGNTLDIKGATALVTGWLKKGDYFQLGTGTASRLYMLTQDADTDSSGTATLTFQPSLRISPADNDALTITGAKGAMRMAGNAAEWQSNQSSIYEASLAFVEAIGE